jgi:hypothetical protein
MVTVLVSARGVVQFRRNFNPHFIICKSARGRKTSGASSRNIHLGIFGKTFGLAQGSAWL